MQVPAVTSPDWQSVGGIALRVTEAVRARQPVDDLARELALAVLATPEVGLAHAVLAGGPHALDRALDLVELVLRRAVAPELHEQTPGAGEGKR